MNELSQSIRHSPWALVGWSGLILAATCMLSPLAADDIPPRLLDAKGWRGTILASVKGLEDDDTYARHDAVMICEVLLDEFDDSDPDLPTWQGKVVSSNLETSYQSVTDAATSLRRETSFQTAGPLEFKSGPQAKLVFHGARGWSFELTSARRKGVVSMQMPKMKPRIRQEETADIGGLAKPSTIVPFPEKRMVLFGSGEVKGVPISFSVLQIQGGQIDETWEWTAYFEPTSVEELKLEIAEPANYGSWRPETSADREKGPPLEVTATLVSSKGGKPNAKVERFEWELQATSKEPGVALNFPLEAKDKKFDLELDASGANFVLSKENQKMERVVDAGLSDTVMVVPYDWGGWSTLQVTAVLVDGRRVSGKLKGKTEQGLRVPKRDVDSHIADGWKNQTGASGADNADDEEVAGQKDNGDGFTLYEEYRGWVENGKHLDGDPKAKDFFVLNLIGADAEPGIDLFAAVSGLAVHSKLLPEEMSETARLMNGNHKQGAHHVDQHGVWVKTFASRSALGDDGAATVMNEKGVAGRPGLVKGVGILARDNTESAFNKPFNLPASDAVFAFDRAIGHELLHSVGVEHHGTGDYSMIVGYASTRNPLNKLGRPYYGTSPDKPVDLRTEAGEDVALKDASEYEKFRQFTDMMMQERMLKEGADYIKRNGVGYGGIHTAQQFADIHIELLIVFCFMRIDGVVGAEHGQHSGAEDCLMRYHFAKYSESKKPASIGGKMYYLIEPGAEHIGMEICHDGKGTGVNAADHSPQARYGDAAGEAGDCFGQICPNDAVPPRSVK
jgi:hypothetical protein